MIIVTGTVQAREDAVDEVVRLSLEHVRRSREEPGCVSHDVHRSVEDPARLFFYERWADADALRAHFAVPASLAFVEALGELTTAPPTMEILDAQPTRV